MFSYHVAELSCLSLHLPWHKQTHLHHCNFFSSLPWGSLDLGAAPSGSNFLLLNKEIFFTVYSHQPGCSVGDFLNWAVLENISPNTGNKPEFSETRFTMFALYHFPAHIYQSSASRMYLSCRAWLYSTSIRLTDPFILSCSQPYKEDTGKQTL